MFRQRSSMAISAAASPYGGIVRTGRGLGQDTTDQFSVNVPQMTFTLPTLPAGYSDSTTFTGLPVYAEIGLGLLGVYVLFRGTQNVKRRVSAGYKAARRAR